MKAAIFILLLGTVSAKLGYRTDREYTYRVIGRSFAALHQVKNEWSGAIYKATLKYEQWRDNLSWAKLENVQFKDVQAPLQQDWHLSFKEADEEGYMPLETTNEPFQIMWNNGVITKLYIPETMQQWELQFIRSIVSQLQVTPPGSMVVPSRLNTLQRGQEPYAVYKVMEETVDGNCEVLYELSPASEEHLYNPVVTMEQSRKNWVQFVKSRNFSNCDRLPVYHSGFGSSVSWEPATNSMGEFFVRSELTRVVKSGLDEPILSSETTSSIVLSPEMYNQQKGEVLSQMNLTLVEISPKLHIDITLASARSRHRRYSFYSVVNDNAEFLDSGETKSVSSSSSSEENSASSASVSSSSESLSTEGWHVATSALEDSPKSPLQWFTSEQAEEKFEESLESLVASEEMKLGSKESLEYFMIVTRIIRAMNYKQLKMLAHKYFQNPKSLSHKSIVFRDAVSQAGTGPTFLLIRDLIRDEKIYGEDAARILLEQANSVMVPTPALVNEFFELLKVKTVSENFHLTTSAAFAFSKLVREAMVDKRSAHNRYPVHYYGPLKDLKSVEEIYVPYFGEQLKKAYEENSSEKIQLYIRVLGNIAYPTILSVFEPYIEGQKPLTDFQRTLLVISLGQLAMIHPKLGQSIMYKFYVNELEPYQVRVAAVYGLMKANAPVDVLQRVALKTNSEKSYQVRSAVKTALETTARLTGEWNQERRRNAAAAVHLLPADVQGIQYTRNELMDYVFKNLHFAFEHERFYIGSQDHLLPQAFLSQHREFYNGYHTIAYKLFGMVSSVRDLIDFANEEAQSVNKAAKPESSKIWDEIQKTLRIAKKSAKQLEGNMEINIAGIERFMSFSNSSLRQSAALMIKLSEALLGGKQFIHQSRMLLQETMLVFPTAIGFPFVYTFSQPTLMSLVGHVKVEINGIEQFKPFFLPKKAWIKPEIDLVFASNNHGRLRMVFDNKKSYMAGNDRHFSLSLPVSGELDVDFTDYSAAVKINLKGGETELARYEVKPFTLIGDVKMAKPVEKQATYKPITVRDSKLSEKIFSIGDFGLRVEVESDKKQLLDNDDVMPALSHAMPFAEKTIESTDLKVFAVHQGVQSVELGMAYFKQRSAEKFAENEPKTEFLTKSAKDYSFVHNLGISLNVTGTRPLQAVGVVIGAISSSKGDLVAILQSPMGKQQAVFKTSLEMPEVSTINFHEAMEEFPAGHIKMSFWHGDKNCEAAVILQRTEERRAHVMKMPQTLQCLAEIGQKNYNHYGCRNATFQAALFDRYEIHANFSGLSEFYLEKIWDGIQLASYYGFPYMSRKYESSIKNDALFEAIVQYNQPLSAVNISLDSSNGLYHFQDVPVHKVVRSVAVVHPNYSILQRVGFASLRQQWEPTCSIDGRSMKTFDNCTHPFNPLNHGWFVLMVSDLPRGNFGVLQRVDSTNRRGLLVFENNHGSHVEIMPSESGLRIKINNKMEDPQIDEIKEIEENQETILQILRMKGDRIKIIISGFEIIHSADKTLITMEKRIPVVGLCGNVDQEPHDMFTPQRELTHNNEEFVASWALEPSEKEIEIIRKGATFRDKRQAPYYSNIISEQDAGRADNLGLPIEKAHYYEPFATKKLTYALHKRLMVVERGPKHCFSTDVLPACKIGKAAVQSVKKTVDFVCVDKTSISQHWERLVNNGARPDFMQKGNSQKIEVDVPTLCSK